MINDWLYNRLMYLFGEVRVANAGMPLIFTEYVEPTTGRKKIHIEQRGETYCVNCPFCYIVTQGRADTRFRLWINHHYGIEDPISGRKFWGLAHCYNENCLASEEFRLALRHIIYSFEKPPKKSDLVTPRLTLAQVNCELPVGLVPINSLDAAHPAIQYLTGEGFDPTYLFEMFNIQFAAEMDPRFPSMFNRIIIPIYMEGKLYGYQGRIPQKSGELKYLTAKGTRISEILYGYDIFPRDSKLAILVEGAKDVWRFGPGALAMFGTHLSRKKVERLRKLGVQYVLVLLDGDIATNPHGMQIIAGINSALNYYELNHSIHVLPDGKDPADLSQEKLYEYIQDVCTRLI